MSMLKPLDAAWLYVESRDTPMHVASLMIFSPPPRAGAGFLQRLVRQMRETRALAPPWNLRLRPSLLRNVLPSWETDHDVDLDYHVRHSALPHPGGERELGVLVSRLHSHPLDFHRPLWECHVIEGLEGGRFALYTKMHHALVDGIGGMRMLQRAMGASSRQTRFEPPWSSAHAPQPEVVGQRPTAARSLRGPLQHLPDTSRALLKVWRARGADDGLEAPYGAPKSILNEKVTAQRRFATQQYPLQRLKAVAAVAGVTLNDIVLAISAGALRRFLKEINALPRRSLTAGLPVSIRTREDSGVGTAISFILASLGTDRADPLRRLRAIQASTRRAKQHLRSLPPAALISYTTLFMGPFIGELLCGLGGVGRPMFSLAISNVPGPEKPMYLSGARLEAMFPVSVLTHGQALNITCVSYAGQMNFGFTGCRDTLPHMQRLSVYAGEALDELEQVVNPGGE